jgi:ketosteroid isomerase-like protein
MATNRDRMSYTKQLATNESEREVRALISEWTRDSSKKDIQAAMKPYAANVLSYEHVHKLAYKGRDEIREVCQEGFDAAPGEFQWDIPDLEVVTAGDLAVTWGLNRMRFEKPDGTSTTIYSRGTRIFQKIDGRWQLVHSHLSYPFDPQTGKALTGLKP